MMSPMNLVRALPAVLITILVTGCGTENLADCEKGKKAVPCQEKTPNEKAQLAMNAGDLDTAIELLEAERAKEPENYKRFPLLAAAYAGKAGFKLFNILNAGGIGGASSGLLDQVGAFLPTMDELGETAYRAAIESMSQSVAILKAMPADHRVITDSTPYGGTAAFQLSLYQSAYSIMYIKLFAVPAAAGADQLGKFDKERLEQMSDAEAEVILNSLAEAAANSPDGQGDAMQTKINETLSQVDSQPGSSTREKLISFLGKS